MVAEMGALTRFDTPRELMKFLGLIPSEYSVGEQRRQGSITKAGNAHARRVLVEGAWASRYPAKVSRHLQLRLETPPKIIQDLRWKAQVRRCKRYRRLMSRGTHAHVVTGAIARELAGFLWAIARELPLTASAQQIERIPPRTQKVYQRASEETQPRCGVTRGSVKRLVQDTRA